MKFSSRSFLTLVAPAACTALASIAAADPCEWSPLGAGIWGPETPAVRGLTGFNVAGSGPAIYAGGGFTIAGGAPAGNIARWDLATQTWASLGSGIGTGALYTLAGLNSALFVGGSFSTAGGSPASNIARWDGQSWSALGAGTNGLVWSLMAFDGDIYAAGAFTSAGGVPASRIASWDGEVWSPLGAGVDGSIPDIYTLAIFDDGGGAALYAGGYFTTAGGNPASRIAKWDGAAWSALGGGISGSAFAAVHGMAVFNDGSGPALYAGGDFNTAGSISVNNIARWDGQSWSAVGAGVDGLIWALTALDGHLYAAGDFNSAGGGAATRIARWNGQTWSPLESGVDARAWALTAYEGAVYIGGNFDFAGGLSAGLIASWECEPSSCYANCDGSTVEPILNVDDFTCFINEFAAAQALPHAQQVTHYANCDGSAIAPVLNVDDFTCFINAFAQGCS